MHAHPYLFILEFVIEPKPFTTTHSSDSGPFRVDCSVPHGLVLGPNEFIAYAEELAVLIDNYQLGQQLYADDVQLMKRTVRQGA
jgi:hypothetical protein